MVKNGGPDLKRAQHTGLSARRAVRTKSRGPKGLRLEVALRRSPLNFQYTIQPCIMYIQLYSQLFMAIGCTALQLYSHITLQTNIHSNKAICFTSMYIWQFSQQLNDPEIAKQLQFPYLQSFSKKSVPSRSSEMASKSKNHYPRNGQEQDNCVLGVKMLQGNSCKIGNIPVPGTSKNQNCQFHEIHHFSLIFTF